MSILATQKYRILIRYASRAGSLLYCTLLIAMITCYIGQCI